MSASSPSGPQRMPKDRAGEIGCSPSPRRRVTCVRQHVDDPLREIEVGPARAGLPVHVAVRGHQGGDVGHMHPEPVPVQADGVVRVLVALVVDRIGRQAGQVQAILLRDLTHRQVRRRRGDPATGRIGVVVRRPVADPDQHTVGVGRCLLVPQGHQDAAVGGLAAGQTLHLHQARVVLRRGLALRPYVPGRRPSPVRPRPWPHAGRDHAPPPPPAGPNGGRAAGKIEPIGHLLPGGPGGGRGEVPVGQFRQLPQIGLATLQKLPGLQHGALAGGQVRRAGPGARGAAARCPWGGRAWSAHPPARSRSSPPGPGPGPGGPCTAPGH